MKLSTKIFTFCIALGITGFIHGQNSVGIGTNSPNTNAVLDLVSPNQGILIPRLSSGQIGAMTLGVADEGMMVYDSTNTQFMYWDGTVWTTFGGSDTDWQVNVDSVFNLTANVGIGTSAPLTGLQVGEGYHMDWANLGPEKYAFMGGNAYFDGTNFLNTLDGASVFSYFGDDNGDPVLAFLLNDSAAAGTAQSPSIRYIFQTGGLAINQDNAEAGLDILPFDSINILMEPPPTGQNAGIYWRDRVNFNKVGLLVPNLLKTNYTITLPDSLPDAAGEVLVSDALGNLSWQLPAGGGGDIATTLGLGKNAASDSLFNLGALSINTNVNDPSSVMEVTSTTAGVLIPRMDSTQRAAISNPANGLLVFQTNDDAAGGAGFYYYSTTTSSWIRIQDGRSYCRPGYLAGNDKYCIDEAERAAQTYWDAVVDCGSDNARLCTFSEWYYACNIGITAGATGNFEWIEYGGLNSGHVVGSASCESMSTDAKGNSHTYRCCYSK